MRTAQIIPFPGPKDEVPAEWRKPKATGLPFVSKETNEFGWPKVFWLPPDGANYDDGIEYGRMAFEAAWDAARKAESKMEDALAGRTVARTLEAIIMQQAKKWANGGKGSRSMDAVEIGFIAGLCREMVTM